MSASLVECANLVHIYKTGSLEVIALQGLDLSVARGEMVAIVGRSGSGKTTLMNVLAGLEIPSAGRARVAGYDLTQLSQAQRESYSRKMVGYLWQNVQVNLMPELNALENVQMPLLGSPGSSQERVERAASLLKTLRMEDRFRYHPNQLSAGEQQRLALAVALANQPTLLLADEPTARLDSAAAREVLEDLRRLQTLQGMTIVMVTHDREVEEYVDRVVMIRDGRTSTETRWWGEAGRRDAQELVILDAAGRLQIPGAYIEALGLKERVRVRLEGGRVIILPADRVESDD